LKPPIKFEGAEVVAVSPRILIVDDHEIVREGLRNLLSQSRPGWVICGQASNGEEAVEAVRDLEPDAVLLDISMPVMNGLEAARRIAQSGAGCRILMFTMHESDRLSHEVQDAGAQGYVLKSQAAQSLVVAIETVLEGGTFFGVRAKC
jgi:DNA-binding NarL/FixJ family response regulator